MAWSTAFEALMPDTVTVAALSGLSTDGYGTPTFSTAAASYPARVVRKQHLVRNLEGIEEMATTLVWIASTSTFAPSSQFTLPDGSSPENVMAIDAFPDEDGMHHVRLSFG